MSRSKVTVVGAGNVGATAAQRIFDRGTPTWSSWTSSTASRRAGARHPGVRPSLRQ